MRTAFPKFEETVQLARKIWRERGYPTGCDTEIWLEAERLLNASNSDVMPPERTKSEPQSNATSPERIKSETAAESVTEYYLSPAPPEDEAIKAALPSKQRFHAKSSRRQ